MIIGKDNVIKTKSFLFFVRIVNLYKFLTQEKKEFIISKQLLRSGTSVGALVRESEHAESKADFIHKLSVALKEANETEYWLDLLKETDYLNELEYISIQENIKEILKILVSIIKTSK
ncbi:four helix bundle protein [Lutibacter sp. B1]|nr:four helix bundle protein [Lutibacter sp. B1]NLP58914.1 four helix bundle protein [Lutibacter sp. B1]